MDPFEILKQFGEYIHYDPDQHKFNLLSNEYTLHKAGDTITTICNRFDSSGRMAVLYAKKVYLKTIADTRLKLVDVLQNRQGLEDEFKMYDVFVGEEVTKIESDYIEALHQTVLRITGKQEIGERDLEQEKKVVYDSLDAVLESLGSCYKDVYVNSHQPVGVVVNISTKILLFNHMADCVLMLENKAPDGAYLCYINNNGTADGYFAIVIKSNGNLFSVNDRVSERYIGQHSNSRNGRWSEGHKDFFPYEAIMTFDDYDYKGYATKYNIDESKLSLADLDPSVYVPIILAILCVINDQVGKVLDDKYQVYMNTLMRSNLERDENSTALIQIDHTGLIEKTTQLLDIHFDPVKMMDGSYNDEFKIHTSGHGQQLVNYWGGGYVIKTRPLSVTARTALSSGEDDETVHAEFVGSLEKMREQAYYEARRDLADYVRDQYQKELDAFGGLEAVEKWFCDAMRQNMPNMLPLLARLYSESKMSTDYRVLKYREDDPKWIRHIRLITDRPYAQEQWIYGKPHKIVTWSGSEYIDYYQDLLTDNKAYIWFSFESYNWSDIEAFTGQQVCGPLRGWRSEYRQDMGDAFSCGNPLLDIVDAVDFVKPLTKDKSGYRIKFDYYAAFSKRGMNRLLKENGFKMPE